MLRLTCIVKFRTENGWSEPVSTVIDTGAHTSIFPPSVWKEINTRVIGSYFVKGLVPKDECILDVDVAWVRGKIIDRENHETAEIRFRAYLAPLENVPTIIGFKDVLEKFKVFFDATNRIAYLER